MHNLKGVAACQPGFAVTRPRYDLLIPLHRHLAGVQTKRDQQSGDGQRPIDWALKIPAFSVQCQSYGTVHGPSMGPAVPARNVGGRRLASRRDRARVRRAWNIDREHLLCYGPVWLRDPPRDRPSGLVVTATADLLEDRL